MSGREWMAHHSPRRTWIQMIGLASDWRCLELPISARYRQLRYINGSGTGTMSVHTLCSDQISHVPWRRRSLPKPARQ